jgi:two-component system phosphate regulon sensor histidine kinase PhoR
LKKKFKLHSTFFKFFISNLFLIFLLAGLILFFSFRTLRIFYLHQLEDTLDKLALALSDQFVPYLEKKDKQTIDYLAKVYGKRLKLRITVIAPDGTVLGDSEKDPKTMENHANRPEIKQALKAGKGTSLRFSATLQKYMLYLAIPVYKDKKILGVFRLSIFAEEINELLGRLKRQLLNLVFLLSFFASLLAFFFSQTFSRPLALLAEAVSSIAKGNLKTHVTIKSNDELGQLARHLNEMARQLEHLFQELSLEREELKAIMHGLQAGLVVLDLDGKILIANKSFQEMTQAKEIKGKFYWEILREPALNAFLQQLRQQPANCLQEITIGNGLFLCSATYMHRRKKLVLIFHDITPLKEIERVKRDLVASVSHELKTPLTAIRGYIETLLEEEEDEKKRYYLEIIDRHTKRLCNIVNDLLTLSALETKRKLTLEKVNLAELLKKIKDFFSSRLEEKRLNLRINIAPEAETIVADGFKLEQLFLNLLDNAIKYTEKGEISIEITPLGPDQIKIIVADTGTGIPKEHLPYIFERFYVVDKSRSRRTGGTGLGLSIVKHIVQLHRGKIEVESQLRKGTKFTIILPKAA